MEEGQVTAVGENYSMPGFEKKDAPAIDYDDETLRANDPPSSVPSDKPTYWAD